MWLNELNGGLYYLFFVYIFLNDIQYKQYSVSIITFYIKKGHVALEEQAC
jgi:hypothetical protein